MTTREILTIQLGQYSNFIGTHWWNIQENNFSYDPNNPSEINHDVLYREGENLRKQTTFTPRLLIADLKGNMGYMSKRSTLYDTAQYEEPSLLWDTENVEIIKEDPIPKPLLIKSLEESPETTEIDSAELEDSVNTWVDYLLPRFHPRTVNVVQEYRHNCTSNPFNIFGYGRSLWSTEQFLDDFSDRIRAYVEECESIQGFQILLDSTDGFAGLGTSCVQYLRDEYGKSIISFPCVSGEPSGSELVKVINTALCWQQLGDSSSLFSPLCCGESGWPQMGNPRKFEHLTYNLDLKYHSGAILATALDTLSLRYRLKEYPHVSLSDLCADLNKLGRKAATTSLSLPFPMTAKMDLIDVLDDYDGPLWTSLTPSCEVPVKESMQSVILRGITEERLKRPINEAKTQTSKPAYRCSTVHEMLTLYLACTCHASATYVSTLESGLKIKQPYPKIFNTNITKNGDVAGWPVGTDVESVPVMAGLHSGNTLAAMYESLYTQAKRVKSIKKFHAFIDSGLEEDEFSDCLCYLLDCKEAYEDHYI